MTIKARAYSPSAAHLYFSRLILLIGLILCSFLTDATGQDLIDGYRIDSLKKELERTNIGPRKRISTSLRLVSLYKNSHPDVEGLIESAVGLAEKNQLNFFMARSLRYRARYNMYVNAPRESIKKDIRRIDSLGGVTRNKLIPGWVSQLKANYFLLIEELDSAEVYIDELEQQLVNRNTNIDRSNFQVLKGMYHYSKKEYKLALESYEGAKGLTNNGKAYLFNNIARLYIEIEDGDEALIYTDKSLEQSTLSNSLIPRVESLILKGEAFLLKKDTVQAKPFFIEAENLRSESHVGKNYTGAHHLIEIYKKTDPFKIESIVEDLSSYEFTPHYALMWVEKGRYSISIRDYNNAYLECKHGLDIALKRKKHRYAYQACDCLEEIDNASDQVSSDTDYTQLKIDLQSRIDDEAKLKSLAVSLANYESKKLKELEDRNRENEEEIEKQISQKFIVAGALMFLLLMAGLMYGYSVKKRNRKIREQEASIEKARIEKEALLKEIHHRVKNNLQMVSSLMSLQSRSAESDSARNAINTSKERIRTMAILHQDIYNEDSNLGVKKYIKKLSDELMINHQHAGIDIRLNIEEIELTIDTLIPLGLIVNELISATIQNALPSDDKIIEISLKELPDRLSLILKDSGRTCYEGFDTFGKTLVRVLSTQLEGEVEDISGDDPRIEVSFYEYN